MKWLNIVTNVLLSVSALIFLVVAGGSVYPGVRDWVMSLIEPEDRRPSGMLATEEAKRLTEQNMRRQIVTFDKLQPLTVTPANLYMIGVGQNTLHKPEKIDAFFLTETRNAFTIPDPNYESSHIPDTDRWKPNSLAGNFNNILIYNSDADEIVEVFHDRVLVAYSQANWAEKPTHLVLFAVTQDSNGDGLLSAADNYGLSIYNISKHKLIRVKHINLEPREITHIFGADYVILQFLEDRNKDGKFTSFATKDQPEEPLRYMKVDLNTGAISDLVPDEMRRRLQKRLQGEEP